MSDKAQPVTARGPRAILGRASDVTVRFERSVAVAGDGSPALVEALGRVGRSRLIEGLSRQVMREANSKPGAAALTHRESRILAGQIVDRLIAEAQNDEP